MNWHHEVRRISERSATAGRVAKWLTPGMNVKRYFVLLILSLSVLMVGFLHFVWTGPYRFIATKWILFLNSFTNPELMPLWAVGLIVTLLALTGAIWSVYKLNRTFLKATGLEPSQAADHMYSRNALARGPKIVALGGGTGLSNLLSGLKEYTSNITAVVAVTDDGGSSGKLRRDLQMIAPGDMTDCFAALSDSPVLARLLLHRFSRGEGIQGHTFGNLMLATLSEERGHFEGAAHDLNDILKVRGRVFPATHDPAVLVSELQNGELIVGESQLGELRKGRAIERVRLDPPEVRAPQEVIDALMDAELIVIGPGSLFTSLIPTVLVPEVRKAIQHSKAKLIYVTNIMSEPGETDDLSLQGHIDMLVRHMGRDPDVILVNDSPLQSDVLNRYQKEGARELSKDPLPEKWLGRVERAPLVAIGNGQHDPYLVSRAITEQLYAPRRRTLH
ncbi:gluconeogenesis factor YvcK family protein [Deinococcus cellulosilyticus]|uniref:Putative gluconeogenesis factor n=1 Tax=Deinococcus cellulosilyticus (strain DSM 18568 / NBRC 106333 / KACC 11606 / 5516J-15) TaxID=1223518 RepID=A0A511N6V2_DEIC1|nr:uridine diphosphate-N-acetylglucosamine-binding protein YvcK [Deinococcus cellulosilyticus]GEM48585.1 putative gluconeogenesis factor [Deinococcus cellulosilyticus NBRC 106333 = KACC 11606]